MTVPASTKPDLADPEQLLTHDAFVQGLARSLMEDAHGAKDLVQDTWLAAIEGAPRNPASLRAWLGRVVRYLAAKKRRAEARRHHRHQLAARKDQNHIPSTAEIVEREAARRQVVQAVLELREPYRSTMLLRFYEDLPPREVARRLKVPVETVRTRIKRALAMLRARLDSFHGGDRRAWCVMLLPLLPRPTPGAAAIGSVGGTLTGMLIMTTKAKLAAMAAVCGVILATLWAMQGPLADEGASQARDPEPGRLVAEGVRTATAPATQQATEKEEPEERSTLRQSLPVPTRGSLLVRVIWGDDKQPAPGVMVKAMAVAGGDLLFDPVHATTGSSGTCLIENLQPQWMYLEPMRGGMGRPVQTDVIAGKQTEVTVEILQGVNLKGVVVSKAGDPVPGADVIVAPWAGGQALALAKTGEDGRFALRSITTHCHVGARAKGHAPSLLHTIIGSKGGNLELHICLGGPGGMLQGRVLDPQGGGEAGAVVEIGGGDGYGPMVRLPDGGQGKAMMPIRARTDEKGRFLVDGLAPGRTPVRVRGLRLAPWSDEAEVLEDGISELVVRLLPGVTLTGTVRDGNARPAEMVEIVVGRYDELGYQRTRTDAAGRYRLEGLPIGKLTVRASSHKLGKAETELSAVAGQDLQWDPVISMGLVLRGLVLDHQGKPVQQAYVEAFPEQRGPKTHWWAHEITGKDGRFELKNCVPGNTIGMRVQARGHCSKHLEGIKPGQGELVIHLAAASKPSIFITGRILDPDGKAVEACSITPCSKDDRGGGVLLTEAGTGAFKYGPYPPGEWQLRVHAKGYPVIRTDWRKVGEGETWDLGTIRLQRPGFLEASLEAADGELGGVSVWVLDAARQYLGRLSVEGSTGRSEPLATGTYYLQVRGGGFAVALHRFEIQSGRDTPLDVRLHRGVPVTLEFATGTDTAEQQAQRIVSVTVVDSEGRTVLITNAYRRPGAKTAVLEFAARPGKYRVQASTADGKRADERIEVGTPRREPVRIVLRQA